MRKPARKQVPGARTTLPGIKRTLTPGGTARFTREKRLVVYVALSTPEVRNPARKQVPESQAALPGINRRLAAGGESDATDDEREEGERRTLIVQ